MYTHAHSIRVQRNESFQKCDFNDFRRARKILSVTELRRSARKPYRQLNSSYYVALSKTLSIPFASLPAQLQIQPVPQTTPTASSTKATTGKLEYWIQSAFSSRLYCCVTLGLVPATNTTPTLNSPTNTETTASVPATSAASPQSPPGTYSN